MSYIMTSLNYKKNKETLLLNQFFLFLSVSSYDVGNNLLNIL